MAAADVTTRVDGRTLTVPAGEGTVRLSSFTDVASVPVSSGRSALLCTRRTAS